MDQSGYASDHALGNGDTVSTGDGSMRKGLGQDKWRTGVQLAHPLHCQLAPPQKHICVWHLHLASTLGIYIWQFDKRPPTMTSDFTQRTARSASVNRQNMRRVLTSKNEHMKALGMLDGATDEILDALSESTSELFADLEVLESHREESSMRLNTIKGKLHRLQDQLDALPALTKEAATTDESPMILPVDSFAGL